MSKKAQRGIVFWLALIVVGYALFSVALAISTASDCPDEAPQEWRLIPPEWDCNP